MILDISDKTKEHKLSLYADDVILYIREPNTSIPELLKHLKNFSEASGYKVNESKLEAMMLSGRWPSELSEKVHFKWSPQGFRYLGIVISSDASQLYNLNYGKLIEQIQKDLERWEILPLSFFGRIETVRTNILPRLLYTFLSLPIWISAAKFQKLQKMILSFIWQRKKPTLKFTHLTNSKASGGLNVPNLKLYYWAAQIRGAVEWVKQNKETTWLSLEQSICPGIALQALPFCSNEIWIKNTISNVWMKCTHKALNSVRAVCLFFSLLSISFFRYGRKSKAVFIYE